MRSIHRRSQAHAPALFALACAVLMPARSSAQWPPDSLENLQVLPANITVPELVNIMTGFTQALGVRCTYCHVGEESMPIGEYDFVSDEKLTKRKARTMLEMVASINEVHLPGLPERATPAITVGCVTCHRGVPQPRQLEDILVEAYRGGGADSAIVTYNDLRDANYGGFAYDFGDFPLIAAAGVIAVEGSIEDAIPLLELNAEMNPGSMFARAQLLTLAIGHAFATGGVEAGDQAYRSYRERFGAAAFPEPLLNTVGYSLLRQGSVDAAVRVFELNVEAYPASSNVYDSLGEGLAVRGDTAAAIRAYERSLELDPNNQNAVERLRVLRGGGLAGIQPVARLPDR